MIFHLLRKREIVLISCSAQYCTFSWISKTQKNNRLVLRAYEQIPCTSFELEKGIVFNPTLVKQWVCDFIKKNNLQQVTIAATVSGSTIHDRLVLASHNTGNKDLSTHFNRHWIWDYMYLCNYNEHALFYVAGIPQSILLQYKLISIALQIPFSCITTERMALLRLYRYAKGSAYRPAQLSHDLYQCNGFIDQLFDYELIHRLLTIPCSITIDNSLTWQHILCASGLYLLQKDINEKN